MEVTKKNTSRKNWARIGEDIKNGDKIIIMSEGETIAGDWGDKQVFEITTTKLETKSLNFNQTSINNLIDGFGTSTAGWVNKVVVVFAVKQMIDGALKNVVYLAPVGWIMTEYGKFEVGGAPSPAVTDGPLDGIKATRVQK